MITIFTHSNSPFTKEFWKFWLRKLQSKYSGPDAVRDSLLRGLSDGGINYELNPPRPRGDTVIVLSGVNALKRHIKRKKEGQIKKLIAGPNLVVLPSDENSVLEDDSIDFILVPSPWVKELWVNINPSLEKRLVIWPAGIDKKEPSSRKGAAIIYDKRNDSVLTKSVIDTLIKSGYKTKLITYPDYKRSNYYHSLREAPVLVYLGNSESQGLALQEAWAHDVPTLVKRIESVEKAKFSWSDPKLAAPYLTDELGYFFDDVNELPSLIERIKNVHPKKYCDQNLSDKATVSVLLSFL